MSTLRLLFKEIAHRKLNFLLGLLAVVAAVSLFVALLTMGRASERETRRLTRDLGFNLLIVPKATNMVDFWATDFAKEEMPEGYVERLAKTPGLMMDHFVATLQKKITWRDRKILLKGLLPERGAIGQRKKSPMGYKIEPGTAYVGYELAQSQKLKKGDKIDIAGTTLTIQRCLPEDGSKTDITIHVHLHDAQKILGKEGKINMIEALGCLCLGHSLATIRKRLEKALPETKVTEFKTIALHRAETREMVEKYVAFIVPVVLLVCAGWVGVLSLINVRERRQEIGTLRALGVGSGRIAALFLGKAIVLGLVGAMIGYIIGTALALKYGPEIFKITSEKIVPIYGLLIWSLVAAPIVAAIAGFLPTMVAVTQDPAVTLTEE
ncbi:MAG: FtsX-like permease family protein [Planctomycetes bacterium]|nr:FtsX-like permease family protein [Planctomycetota bacterium]